MDQTVTSISNRMSLRQPQAESLAILHDICERLDLDKDQDLAEALKRVQEAHPQVTDFERTFPSLCFALATGVGKTRLMGAFITYLYKTQGVRHFFVLAPNLTIYNKLIRDFQPGTPKYVFQGLSEFATNRPEIITGDNYESGRGIRNERRTKQRALDVDNDPIHINIFNISKINVGDTKRKIRRLSEYIGESYFDYLSNLDDLVVLMDESHRYRASAGMDAINELRPILGLELTATPQVQKGSNAIRFKNVIYDFPLGNALIKDANENGPYVKEPAVATRRNMNPKMGRDELDAIKLEDGIALHENTKLALEKYASENGADPVKPFALVVARDIEHAKILLDRVQADEFCEGRYKNKAIAITSDQKTEEKDRNTELLLAVERSDNPIEIVIHVNILGEGWDVTNLYTIIPLRAADSKTLVEQSIGRGLRLPYGKRTGNAEVDRLTIVAHDKFDEIIQYARSPDSVIKKLAEIYVDEAIPPHQVKEVVDSELTRALRGETTRKDLPKVDATEVDAAKKAAEILDRDHGHIPAAKRASDPEVLKDVAKKVAAEGGIEGTPASIQKTVEKVARVHELLTIDIPSIIVQPSGDVTTFYEDFNLDVSDVNVHPVDREVLVKRLENEKEYVLHLERAGLTEKRFEDYLVHGLVDYNDIDYTRDRTLLYKLAGQLVAHLKSYLKTDDEVENALRYHRRALVSLIHRQMETHFKQTATSYEVTSKGVMTKLNQKVFGRDARHEAQHYRTPPGKKSEIGRYMFTGFQKSLFPHAKFQSDPERVFAVILEDKDDDVLKWVKPAKNDFHIYYDHGDTYVPDFIVETKTAKYICEPKAANEVHNGDVQAKAKAGAAWCVRATKIEKEHGGKPWHYLLIPHDAIQENMTLKGFAAAHTVK